MCQREHTDTAAEGIVDLTHCSSLEEDERLGPILLKRMDMPVLAILPPPSRGSRACDVTLVSQLLCQCRDLEGMERMPRVCVGAACLSWWRWLASCMGFMGVCS